MNDGWVITILLDECKFIKDMLMIIHIINRFMMKWSLILLTIFATSVMTAPNVISMAYCGFSGNFCGESINDDVYARSVNVILSYAIISSNGAVMVDADHYPKT